MISRKTIALAITLLAAAVVFTGCGGDDNLDEALQSITSEDLAADIAVLASDEFEGRAPASRGEELTTAYLRDKFQRLGLEPGNGDSYFQEVPLVEMTTDPRANLVIQSPEGGVHYRLGSQFVAWTKRVTPQSALISSDLVFVGYGAVAPEYGWDDYAGLDLTGKTVVMLVNDPGYATRDEALFNGYAMTYYGRWTYKFEEAARQGAEGAIVIHQTGPAGYPWEVVENSWTGPQFDLVSEDGNKERCAVEGWVTEEVARELFQMAGLDFDVLAAQAAARGFQAMPMGLTATITLRQEINLSVSSNVAALLPGSRRSDEIVVYIAHWDHLGRDPNLEGDQIYNGARDNAAGVAGLLELAEAFTLLPRRPARSILFLAVTAEEQGLLGSQYYGENPLYPLAKTVAALNIDSPNVFGPTKDVTVVGYGNSALDDYVDTAAKEQGRVVRPDPEPEKGYYYRSDHFAFAKQGVPALYANPGIDHVEHGEAWFSERLDEYTAERYHKPADEYDPSWDLTGAVEDFRLLFTIGYRLADTQRFPNWREGTEFRAIRDAMMKGSR